MCFREVRRYVKSQQINGGASDPNIDGISSFALKVTGVACVALQPVSIANS
jgi:hypothetical protein